MRIFIPLEKKQFWKGLKPFTHFLTGVTVFLLCLCFLSAQLKAEELLTWKHCVEEAKKNHPDLISAEAKLNQARANKAITRSNLLPQISSDLSGKTSETDDKDKTDAYSYGVSGKQLLFDGFKTSYNLSSASENIKSSQYDYSVVSSNVRLNLRTAFIELLRVQELLHITEDIAKRRKQNLELVNLRYEAGREHKGSLLTAQADLAQAIFEVTQVKRNISLAQRKLTKELGREKLIPVKAQGDFKVIYSERKQPDYELIADTTSFLKELIARKEAARFSLKSSQADFFPQIYANAAAGQSAADWPPDKNEWSAGVSLSFPLFEGGSRIAEVSKAKAVFIQLEADERSGRDNIIVTLENAWVDLQDAMDNVEVQQKFLSAAEERARISRAQYSTGLISFDNWIIIEDNLVKAQKSFLNVQAEALIAEAQWIQAKGGTLDYE